MSREITRCAHAHTYVAGPPRYLFAILTAALLITLSVGGCSRGPQIVPVKGKVLYNGEPLPYGGVMFQPEAGQPARGEIQPDGTFVLSTDSEGDGATVGRNRVRVTAYAAQDPDAAAAGGELPLGNSMIPKRYTDIDTSGLVVEVKPSGNEDVVLELTDEAN